MSTPEEEWDRHVSEILRSEARARRGDGRIHLEPVRTSRAELAVGALLVFCVLTWTLAGIAAVVDLFSIAWERING
jgi:hypothetical protein